MICYACRQHKPNAEFYSSPSQRRAVSPYCAQCARVKWAEWRAANPDRQNASESAYRASHSEEIRARQSDYQRRRYDAIKADPALYAEYRMMKNKQRRNKRARLAAA